MSREEAADGQTNEARFTTKGSKLDLKYQCKSLICFMSQALQELYGYMKQTRGSQLCFLNCIKHYFSKWNTEGTSQNRAAASPAATDTGDEDSSIIQQHFQDLLANVSPQLGTNRRGLAA